MIWIVKCTDCADGGAGATHEHNARWWVEVVPPEFA